MSLALQATVERTNSGGWRVRLPVRREEITIEKRTVVVEEVEIRREHVEDTVHVTADTQREELDARWRPQPEPGSGEVGS